MDTSVGAISTTTSQRKVRLNGRDWSVLSFIGQVRLIHSNDLSLLLGGGRELKPRSVRAVVARWERRGLIERHYLTRGAPSIALTAHARYLLGLPSNYPVGLPSWTQIPHTLATAAVASRYNTGFVEGGVWSEPTHFDFSHTPDGIVETPHTFIAVEVELNRKSSKRWAEILTALAKEWDVIHYWVASDVDTPLRTLLGEALPPAQQEKFRFFQVEEMS